MNGGLISRTSSGKEMHELEREKERLEMVKGDVASNTNHVGKVTVDTYVEELIKQGITVPEEVTDNGDGSKTVITDTRYSVLIEPNGENDVKITIDGKAGALPPRIKKLRTETVEETKLKITVEAIRAEKYKYEYKIDDGNEESGWIVLEDNSSSITATTPALEEETSYMIRVTASNENGTVNKIAKIAQVGEEESVANAPKLSEGMTPVKWNGVNWEKTTENDSSWYNYASSSKKWANVVLGDSTFKTVDGKEVLDEDANYSMLVWIPRYAYKIKSMYHQNGTSLTAGKVSIVFINTQNVNSVTGTKYTRDSASQYPEAIVGGAMSDYVVHPAFDFGSSKLAGFWAGKFESSNTEETTYNGIDKTMMIKANVPSWRDISIGNGFEVCLNMNEVGNVYRLPARDTEVDPHMMKNDEWGAIAYLSISKYGKQNEEIWINNSSSYITGNAGNSVSEREMSGILNAYHTEKGVKASTTGNITGIYDMKGGTWEYTAAYVENNSENLKKYGENLLKNENKKYTNIYMSSEDTQSGNYSVSTPMNGYYGDAIYETSNSYLSSNGSWYADYTSFPYSKYPFFIRGGGANDKVAAGIFYFNHMYGNAHLDYSFRIVIPVF